MKNLILIYACFLLLFSCKKDDPQQKVNTPPNPSDTCVVTLETCLLDFFDTPFAFRMQIVPKCNCAGAAYDLELDTIHAEFDAPFYSASKDTFWVWGGGGVNQNIQPCTPFGVKFTHVQTGAVLQDSISICNTQGTIVVGNCN